MLCGYKCSQISTLNYSVLIQFQGICNAEVKHWEKYCRQMFDTFFNKVSSFGIGSNNSKIDLNL